jgi:hypothetical protein
MLQIIGHAGIGNGNALKPGILDLPAQGLSNNNLNPLRQFGSTCRISHEQLLKEEKFGTYDGGANVSQRAQGLDATHPSEPMTHPLDFFRRPGSGF